MSETTVVHWDYLTTLLVTLGCLGVYAFRREIAKIMAVIEQGPPYDLVPLVLSLEGNIGVGKSTLAEKFRSSLNARVLGEKVCQKFLALFYSDPGKYGFAFQLSMMESRRYQFALCSRPHNSGEIVITDRSVFGDYAFALHTYNAQNLSDEEFHTYEELLMADSTWRPGTKKPITTPSGWTMVWQGPPLDQLTASVDALVYLVDTPARCKERTEQLRGNKAEKNIPLAYYEGIDDMHFRLLYCLWRAGSKKIVPLFWSQYKDDPQKVLTAVRGWLDDPVAPLFTDSQKRIEGAEILTTQLEIDVKYSETMQTPVTTDHRPLYLPQLKGTVNEACTDKNAYSAEYAALDVSPAYKHVLLSAIASRRRVYLVKTTSA